MDTIGPYELNQIYTGDARELSKAIPDESIDLIFTDPVYDRIEDYEWLAETAARVLKPGGDCLVYLGMYHMGAIVTAMMPHLDYRWLLAEKKMTSGGLIWSYRLFSHFIPILWFTKGKPREANRIDFMWSQGEGNGVNHKWSKGSRRAAYWLGKFSSPSDIVFDPFCGGGAIPSACKNSNHPYLGFEISPPTAELARQRVANTQPPLPIKYHEQLDLI